MNRSLLWRRTVLPNGLRVLLFPRQSANTAQLSIAVEYGSNSETENAAGSAHFLEHMLAGGSDKRIALSRSIESYGATLNFYTDREYTMSLVDTLPKDLAKAAQILSQLLFDSTFEQEKLNSERKIILNELAEVSDDPSEKTEELLLKNLFKNHPVNRPIGGQAKTINKLTLKQLSEIHIAAYQPQNMIMMLTGNLEESDVEGALSFFKNKPYQKALPKPNHAAENIKPPKETVKEKSGIAQSYLSLGARTVNARDAYAPALDLISMIIGGGTSSRLFIELREKKGLTYDVLTTHSKGQDYGYFSVSCAVKERNAGKAKEIIQKEISNLRNETVPQDELERNKNLFLAGILRGMDSPEECQDILAFMEIQFRSENALARYLEKIQAVSTSDIAKAANDYLQEDNFSVALMKPKQPM
jgi:predicted Zn-dependent peptidase